MFDVVVVNLYPFYEKVSSGGIEFEDGIENIDIGGPAMIRAAAKVFFFSRWQSNLFYEAFFFYSRMTPKKLSVLVFITIMGSVVLIKKIYTLTVQGNNLFLNQVVCEGR